MADNPYAAFPPRPRDVGEWEDLLVRFELGPRALRFALEDRGNAADAVVAPFARLAASELRVSLALDAMRQGGVVPDRITTPADTSPAAEAVERHCRTYAAARAHNFAALQRRGLGVWDWTAMREGGGEFTAYQLVREALQVDAEVLSAVRAAGREAPVC
jgi:hypothetical protein